MSELKDVITSYNNLSFSDRIVFYTTISNDIAISDDTQSFLTETRLDGEGSCIYCEGMHVVKNGKRKDGVQRFLCRDCHRSFIASTDSITSRTRKSISVWATYLKCMLDQKTLKQSSAECDISISTAFTWRHKILDTLSELTEKAYLTGVVEADETFFPLSFKGNHNKSNFKLPRESHHRGKSNHKRGISSDQVCVPCAINLNGLSKSVITNLGKPTVKDLRKVFSRSIAENSVLVTDRNSAYNKIANEHNLQLVQIKAGKGSVGTFNIAKINSYHSILKMFIIYNFKGVSTKYLNNYLIWNNIKNYDLGSEEEKEQIFADFVFTNKFCENSHDVSKRKAIPV